MAQACVRAGPLTAKQRGPRYATAMRWFIILTEAGRPLCTEKGTVILFASEEAARQWMRAGDRIAEADDGLAGVPPIDE